MVDDELMLRKALKTQLRNKRYTVASTRDLKGARKILARDSFDLVFLDLRLPDGEGNDLLEEITAKTDGPMVVMMTVMVLLNLPFPVCRWELLTML